MDSMNLMSSMYVCMYACMHVCMYVCAYMYVCVCVCACMYNRVCMCVSMYVCMCVNMHTFSPEANQGNCDWHYQMLVQICYHLLFFTRLHIQDTLLLTIKANMCSLHHYYVVNTKGTF